MNNILLIGSTPPPYHGSNISFNNIVNSNISDIYNTYHLDISDHRDLSNLGKFDAHNIYMGIKHILQLIYYLIRNKPNIVYLGPGANAASYLRDGLFIIISYMIRRPIIIIHMRSGTYFRDVFYERSNIFYKYFIRYTLKKVNTAIVLGENLKRTVEGLVNDITVIPNGTNFNPDISMKKYKQNGCIMVSYLGNYLESKGIIDILNAAEIIIKKYNNVIFKFAGNWRDQEHQTRIIVDGYIRNYSGIIQFVGPVYNQEKEKYLLNTDIFVFPSWNESFGLVNIEAMAAGCPVISTKDVGAIPEVVLDGITGILVEKRRPDKIAEAIIKLIEHPELRVSMGKAGRKRYEKYYKMEHNVNKIIELFSKVLES
jgi:glycosyltransferase involved in cell wall biosynthesis